MKKIVFRKKWVARMEEMDKEQKFKCIVALYEYFMNERITVESMKGFEIIRFVKEVIEDERKNAERREIARQRREEKKRKAEEERRKIEQEAAAEKTRCLPQESRETYSPDSQEYEVTPTLYIFDGFLRYLLSKEGDRLIDNQIIPDIANRAQALFQFRKWAIKNQVTEILTALGNFIDCFNININKFCPAT